jgi:hypothetical protein
MHNVSEDEEERGEGPLTDDRSMHILEGLDSLDTVDCFVYLDRLHS